MWRNALEDVLARQSLIAFLLVLAAGLLPAQAAPLTAASVSARAETALSGEIALSFINSVKTTVPNGSTEASWDAVQAQALELSRAQRGGTPETLRFCEPQLNVCNTGVWRAGNGTKLFLRQAVDMSGKSLEREVCEINAFGDVRVCIDWDTNKTSRDMKDRKGHWYKVADQ